MSESTCRVCGAPTQAFMCRNCGRELERACGDMQSLMHELGITATGQARVYRIAPAPKPDPDAHLWDEEQKQVRAFLRSREGRITLPSTATMVNLAANDLLWRAWHTLATWAMHLAESTGTSGYPTNANLLTWLTANAEAARWNEAAAEIHDEITSLRADLRHAVDRSPDRRFAGPCQAELPDGSRCALDLYRQPGGGNDDPAEKIPCDGWQSRPRSEGCGAVHTVGERAEWLVGELSDAILPLSVLRPASHRLLSLQWPPHATVRSWHFRGRIESRGPDRNGEDMFPVADVIKLVREWNEKRAEERAS